MPSNVPEIRWRATNGVVHILGSRSAVYRTECLLVIGRVADLGEPDATDEPATCFECIREATREW